MQCNTVAKLQLYAPTCANKLKDFCSLGFNMPRMFIFYNITYNPLSFLVIFFFFFFLLIMLTNHMQSNNTAMDNTNNMNQIKIHFTIELRLRPAVLGSLPIAQSRQSTSWMVSYLSCASLSSGSFDTSLTERPLSVLCTDLTCEQYQNI